MARKPRIHVAGALYHVILRGNNRQPIFCDDADRRKLEELIANGAQRFGYRLFAYCWMGNHIHAAIRVNEVSLTAVMHNLGFRYTGYFNFRHKRIGHLFHGRYKAILVDSDSYLLQLVRYIHQNPVRASIVDDPADYLWSSHCAYLGKTRAPGWLDTDLVLDQFGGRAPRAAYRRYMGMPEPMLEPVDFKRGNQKIPVLGDELFAHRMLNDAWTEAPRERIPTGDIVAAVCKASGMSITAMRTTQRQDAVEARAAAAYLQSLHGEGTMRDLGRHLSRDSANLSRAAAKCREAEESNSGARQVAVRAAAILRDASLQA